MMDKIKSTRRGVLGAMAAGALAAGAAPATAQGGQKTFVLVHGGWHGAWCWRRVSDLLEKKGHKVYSPTMTGVGACSHLLNKDINLTTHITDIVNLIHWEELSDVVLVGHSYAGLIISVVAEKIGGKIGSIVFLDAFVPENGDNVVGSASQLTKDTVAAAQARGEISLKPLPAAFLRVNEADRAWVDAKCTPQPIATFTDKVEITGARDKIAKKSYIRAVGYPSVAFDVALSKYKSNGAWKTFSMTAGHDAMLDQPKELTDILLQVA